MANKFRLADNENLQDILESYGLVLSHTNILKIFTHQECCNQIAEDSAEIIWDFDIEAQQLNFSNEELTNIRNSSSTSYSEASSFEERLRALTEYYSS